jgi:hypothetical protein
MKAKLGRPEVLMAIKTCVYRTRAQAAVPLFNGSVAAFLYSFFSEPEKKYLPFAGEVSVVVRVEKNLFLLEAYESSFYSR